jgi:hypothetical protein
MRVQLQKLNEDQLKGLETFSQMSPEDRNKYESEMIYRKWAKAGWLDLEDIPKEVKIKTPKRYAEMEEFHEQMDFPKLTAEQKRKMSLILNNQAMFQSERKLPVIGDNVSLIADTATSDEALPTRFALPIVRRVYSMLMQRDFSVVQPLPGPSAWIFWLDFIRESDTTNILSVEYNWNLTAEFGIPAKGKMALNRIQLQVVKQLMGTAFSLEAQEDARAQLGLDVEAELVNAFTEEFGRNLMGRHLQNITRTALGLQFTSNVGQSLVQPWAGPNAQITIATRASLSLSVTDYKQWIYNALIDADVNFQKANRRPSNAIIAGYGMAGFLSKANTATQSLAPNDNNLASIGITDYGTYAGRWKIWGTDFLPDNVAFLYLANPPQMWASHIYAPYVPLQVMPAVYGDYSTSTGAYTNVDAWTRNIRERSADFVTKSYGFQAVIGPQPLSF